MTRYTKLDGRRSIPSANNVDVVDEQVEDKESHASEDRVHDEQPPSHDENAQDDIQDPKKLLKRAKLLRLKGKKSSSEEAKKKHLKNAKLLEQQAAKLNGVRGVLGKRKNKDEASKRVQRPRLSMCSFTNQRCRSKVRVSAPDACTGARCKHALLRMPKHWPLGQRLP